jgi:hypothetical protein
MIIGLGCMRDAFALARGAVKHVQQDESARHAARERAMQFVFHGKLDLTARAARATRALMNEQERAALQHEADAIVCEVLRDGACMGIDIDPNDAVADVVREAIATALIVGFARVQRVLRPRREYGERFVTRRRPVL